MKKDKNKPVLTTAQTDSESGTEGLEPPENKARHEAALKALLDKGLISKEEYQQKLKGS